MDRTITYTISQEAEGLRIEQFLRRQGYSRQNLAELRQMPQSTQINGQFRPQKERLLAKDILSVHIHEVLNSPKVIPMPLALDIIYEDEDIIVVNKPAGMAIHPSMHNTYHSVANALAYYYQQQGLSFIFRCSNRLDCDTSGLTVIAKHLVSASILASMVANKEVEREYLAIVRGALTPDSGTIDLPLGRRPGPVIERFIDYENGERAITHYRRLDIKNGHSLVSLLLETGRTHQIRIHMKAIGFPLIGDYLYNPDMEYISRQALHSHRLAFYHPITHEFLEFRAPLPDDMRSVLVKPC